MKYLIFIFVLLQLSILGFTCNNSEQQYSQENVRLKEEKNQLNNEISSLKDSITRINSELQKVSNEKIKLVSKTNNKTKLNQITTVKKVKMNTHNSKPGYDKKRDAVKLDFGRTNIYNQYRRK